MSTFFISDLHIGHRKILDYAPGIRGGTNTEEHTEWLIKQWNSVVKSPKDLVWVLGDVCFDRDQLPQLGRMRGRKKLVMGNHDVFHASQYLDVFEELYGLHKRYGAWLSHAPVHPQELRGKFNLHGHMHWDQIDNDPRYINVSVEQCDGIPIHLDQIKERMKNAGE